MDAVIGKQSSGFAKRGWFGPRNVVLLVVAAAILCTGGGVTWTHFSNRATQVRKVDQALAKSHSYYNKAEYQNAIAVLGGMAVAAPSNKQKAEVYQAEAQAASAMGKLQDAVSYYAQKHALDKGSVQKDAYTLGTIYDRLGQKDNALTQYKIALVYAGTQKNQYGSDAPAIQAAIDALEKQ
jgi:tetratricopeptide (TPR) repeat protein